MYFQQLETLKDFDDISGTDIILFDAVLFSIYEKGLHRRFNPRVHNQLGIQLNEQKWLKSLEKLTQMGYLDKTFELCSPYSSETIKIYKKMGEIPLGSCIYSSEDNAEFEITESDIFITYSFNDSFHPIDLNPLGSEEESSSIKKSSLSEQGSLSPPLHLGSQSKDLSLGDWMSFDPGSIVDQYVEERREKLVQMLDNVNLADDSTSKGNTLEDLIEHLFSFPFFKFYGKKVKNATAEIDVVFTVKKILSTIFENFSDLVIVESKNWGDKAGASDIKVFSDKMKETRSEVGLFFSKKGVTGRENYQRDARGVIRDKWKTEKQIIIVFDLKDLNNVIKEKHSLYSLLYDKYYKIRLL